ncbi:hypothetical protein [Granulicella sp. dw_53]|uniref:hypothetical protein n=1 Tax=Granulicella sp. dw_53 TaxID=2719792 RepID=UPI001BD67927|nr:hypothetical protein [Granulicella sp. dw_53]
MTNPADTQQYTELTQHYGTLANEELNELALTYNDLTEPAQQALKAEFNRRGLSLPTPSQDPALKNNTEDSPLQSFAANPPEECTFEFTDVEEAYLAQSLLKSAGIPSILPTSELGAIDTPRLIVGPSDAVSAQLLLSRPNALGTVTDEDAIFPTATCPQCGTPDPLLESVEPTNHWLCEACNHRWQDAPL